MKFFTVFAAILSVAFGYQASWTLDQLSQALQNPATDPTIVPYLEKALNEMMDSLFNGHQITAVTITIPAIDLSTWSLPQLTAAMENPTTDPALMPYLEQALNHLMEALFAGEEVSVTPVVVPAMDVSSWTLNELSDALQDPATHPALIPHLEHALNDMMSAIWAGQQMDSIIIAVPAGLLPVPTPVSPVVPVAPIDAPVVPVNPVSPAAPSSPLVQIVVNVNGQAAAAPVATPVQPKPEPVIIVDEAVNHPAINPIDLVAISPPMINPVDILHPIGVVAPIGAVDIVGPIV